MKKIELICFGNELLIGKTVNTNANWLGKRLLMLGAELQRISSSENLERCIMTSEATETSSIAKSRSLTPSSEFSQMPSKPSSLAVNSLSIG